MQARQLLAERRQQQSDLERQAKEELEQELENERREAKENENERHQREDLDNEIAAIEAEVARMEGEAVFDKAAANDDDDADQESAPLPEKGPSSRAPKKPTASRASPALDGAVTATASKDAEKQSTPKSAGVDRSHSPVPAQKPANKALPLTSSPSPQPAVPKQPQKLPLKNNLRMTERKLYS